MWVINAHVNGTFGAVYFINRKGDPGQKNAWFSIWSGWLFFILHIFPKTYNFLTIKMRIICLFYCSYSYPHHCEDKNIFDLIVSSSVPLAEWQVLWEQRLHLDNIIVQRLAHNVMIIEIGLYSNWIHFCRHYADKFYVNYHIYSWQ